MHVVHYILLVLTTAAYLHNTLESNINQLLLAAGANTKTKVVATMQGCLDTSKTQFVSKVLICVKHRVVPGIIDNVMGKNGSIG